MNTLIKLLKYIDDLEADMLSRSYFCPDQVLPVLNDFKQKIKERIDLHGREQSNTND